MKQYQSTIAAIIIGGALTITAFIFVQNSTPSDATTLSPFRTEMQNVYGSKQADITIVEFSDVECPFCAQVHPTIKRLVDESEGRINWEYRHLPLPFHENAEFGALVSECVAENAGNTEFWEYLDEIFTNQENLSRTYIIEAAAAYGVTADDITNCQSDEGIAARLANDVTTAAALGGSGTPYSVIVFPDGVLRPVSGALPFEQWETLLDRS